MAALSLRSIPDYGKREVVIVYGSLSTCDPGDIFDTIKKLVKLKIRVRVMVIDVVVGQGKSIVVDAHFVLLTSPGVHHLVVSGDVCVS